MPVVCPYCSREFQGERLNARHLAKCNPEASPEVEPCLCGHKATSLTQMKRHRRTCGVWQNRDKKAIANARRRKTSLERYGTENATQTPEALGRRARTNQERYGATNPFSREASTFEKVQMSLEGKRPVLRGSDNPFSRPDVQEEIRPLADLYNLDPNVASLAGGHVPAWVREQLRTRPEEAACAAMDGFCRYSPDKRTENLEAPPDGEK